MISDGGRSPGPHDTPSGSDPAGITLAALLSGKVGKTQSGMHYFDFRLDFVPHGLDGVAVRVAYSPAGEGSLEPLEPSTLRDNLALAAQWMADRQALELRPSEPAALGSLGGRLYDGTFRGSVRRLFERTLGALRPDQGLRLRLQIDLREPRLSPLHSLPWELLFEPTDHHPFALDRRFSIVRHVPRPHGRPRREPPGRLRILLVAAQPRAARLLSIEEEVERIHGALDGRAEIEVLPLVRPTQEALRRALVEEDPIHVLHFMGHAEFDVLSGAGKLLFEDGRRGAARVSSGSLADRLRDRSTLRLVFLNACGTARSAPSEPFGGVAAALVRAGIPSVVAMQCPIADRAAIAFSETVYRRLAAGDSIDAAVTEGRHAVAVRCPEPGAWAIPVLFSHAPDERLFDPPPAAPEAGPRGRPSKTNASFGGEPVSFPAPRPLHQLPIPPADFVGRDSELRELRAAISEGTAAVCALFGMGGVGKTTLAVRLGHELRESFPDGQIFVDLRGMSETPLSPSEAAAHVIRSFHPESPLPDDARLFALYREVLQDRRVLLLLDDASGREQVEPMVPPGRCALLVTSRQRFSLPGLVRQDLGLLPEAEACALLRRISPRIGPNAPEIAKQCGELPFALRLAAGTLAERSDLSVAGFLDRLTREGQRAKLGHAVLGVGHALLPERLQRRFRLLAVFPAGFDAPAAAAIWDLQGQEDETDDSLGELVRRSLLDGEDGRYRLHDLARAFAGSGLTADEREAAQERHARHYLDRLAAATEVYLRGGENILDALAVFDRERPHFVAGQGWAAARAETSRAAAWAAARYAYEGSHLLKLRLSREEQIVWVEAGLAAARRLADRPLEGALLGDLGITRASLGQSEEACTCFEQSLALARAIGDRRGESNALGNLGNAYAERGDPRRAIDLHAQDLVLRRELGDRRGEGNALGNLGTAYADLGDTERAIELYRERIEIAREIGDRRGDANACWNLGAVYETRGDLSRAVDSMQVCVDFEREIGHPDAERDAAHVEALRARLI